MALDWHLQPILFLLMTAVQSAFVSSVSESEALIKLKSSFKNNSALGSWASGSAPCETDTRWTGVICLKGNVTGLQLEHMGLAGQINVDALLEISGLRTISFSYNSFSGSIPEINRLGYLRGIYLSGNQFSGEIHADFFSKMNSLKKIWLSDNHFSGAIPSSLSELSNLIELRLENNEFSGKIPAIRQPSLKKFNVSNNKLEGSIPPGFGKFDASSFGGNAGLCGDKVGKICNTNVTEVAGKPVSGTSNNDGDKDTAKKVAAGVIALAIMLILVAVVLIAQMRRKKRRADTTEKAGNDDEEPVEVQVSMPTRPREMELTKKAGSGKKGSNQNKGGIGELVMVNDEKGVFRLTDLMKSAAEVLGNGGLGSSYKTAMANGMSVVVKRMREMNSVGKEQFDKEVRKLGSLRHPNVLTPLAYHYRKEEKLFIYDYKPNGSLLYLLHGDHGPSHSELDWPARLKIVKGIARGLDYIHSELAYFDLPHGNLRASNILMDSDNEPLLSEFGFRPLINPAMVDKALFAFKAPEAVSRVTPKCDMFCLGIIILEILTGKFPSQYISNSNGGTDLVELAKIKISEGQEHELLDPEIASATNSLGEIVKLLQIGLACAETDPELRPEMKEAILSIEEIKLENDSGYQPRTVQVLPSFSDGFAGITPSLRDGFPGALHNNASIGNESELSGTFGSSQFSDRIQHPDSDQFSSPIS